MSNWTALGNGLPQADIRFMFINYNENLNGYRKKHFCENSREGLPACQTCNRRSPVTGDNREDYMNLIRMNEM